MFGPWATPPPEGGGLVVLLPGWAGFPTRPIAEPFFVDKDQPGRRLGFVEV